MVVPYFHSRPGLVESARPEVRLNGLACFLGTPELICLDGSRQPTTQSSEDSPIGVRMMPERRELVRDFPCGCRNPSASRAG
jgi:hypothetical protein